MPAPDFSLYQFLNNPIYTRRFRKYFRRNVYLDTFAFCLLVEGKFDENYDYNILSGEKEDFMKLKIYKKLVRFLDRCMGKPVVTPAVVYESIPHISDAIENACKDSKERWRVEQKFADFLQDEIRVFREKCPTSDSMLNHNWTEIIKTHKLRNRFEVGELSIFVELDKCKYGAIITDDQFKINKTGESHVPENALLIQLSVLAVV